MGKSCVHHPISSYVRYHSNAKDRSICNRALRRVNRQRLHCWSEDTWFLIPREVRDTYDFASDGLPQWMGWSVSEYWDKPWQCWAR